MSIDIDIAKLVELKTIFYGFLQMSQTTAQPSQKTDKEQDLLYAEVEVNDSPSRFVAMSTWYIIVTS